MRIRRTRCLAESVLVLGMLLGAAGCFHTPVDVSGGPAPLRIPSPAKEGCCHSYEDSLTGGKIFAMYCGYCHNAPSLAERPFSNYKNVAAHMRVRANLTGKEYAKLMAFLRRWHDVPPPNPPPPLEPSPKRLIFSQPMQELRDQDKDKDGKKDKKAGQEELPMPGKGAAPAKEELPAPQKGPALEEQ